MSPGLRYAGGALAGLGGTLARYVLVSVWDLKYPFLTFYPAVMLAAWYGGLGPGLLAVAVVAAGGWYFTPPIGFVPMHAWEDLLAWVLFVGVICFIVGMTEAMHRQRRRAETARDAAQSSAAESRAAAAATLEGEQRLLLAQQIASIGTFEWNVVTGVSRWTPELEHMYGLQAGGFPRTQEAWESLVHQADRAEVVRQLQLAMEKGEFAHEWRVVLPDGRVRWLAGRGFVFKDGSGRPMRLLGVNIDITDRKQAEAEREELLAITQRARARAEAAVAAEHEARKAAEAASGAKDAFLATISHELRTPLSPILAWSRLLLGGTLDEDKHRHAVEVIERCAKAQTQLIEDLLDVSRIIAGKMRLEVRPVHLTAIIEAAIEVVRPAATAKGVRLQSVLDTETGVVSGDPDRLQQVIWNLLSNAVKFTPKGGRVNVVLKRVNSHVEIAVSDTGPGIAAEFLPHVFERFQQADHSTTRAHGGLGLGLAIVRHIVEAHGGSVHAESPGPGQGADFTVKLPLTLIARTAGEMERRHPAAAGIAHVDKLHALGGLRVLVIDDEPDSNEVVRTIVASSGAEVRVAASAAQAREVLTRWNPDLLVSDIGMPGEDGYELLHSIRSLKNESANLPAVALTAYASREDRIRLLSAGFYAHVPKPLDPAELVTVIASLARTTARLK